MPQLDYHEKQTALFTEHLASLGYETAEAFEISQRFINEFSYKEPIPVQSNRLGLLVGKYAIRKDDLNLFDCVVKAVQSAASAGFFVYATSGSMAASKCGIVFALIQVVRDLRNKGDLLQEEEVKVLTILKSIVPEHSSMGIRAEELLKIVQLELPSQDMTSLTAILQKLSKYPMRGGMNKELVSQSLERWRPHV